MQYHLLPHSQLEISKICLGTMTFGEQNTQPQAFEQLDYAKERGVNFIDTAEMYPVPPKQGTQGATETIIGNWLKKTGSRDKAIIATKVAGPRNVPYIRENMSLDWRNVHQALHDSLERLNTDYIDLYQIHWPQRQTNCFGQLNYTKPDSEAEVNLVETLEALGDLVNQGKVRYIGVSNETPWGLMTLLKLAEKHNLPRIVSIQNPYSLLNRSFEVGLSEIAHFEGTQLLAYSPLAFGVLSGKYLGGTRPQNARCTLFERFVRYFTPNGELATKAYVELAREHGLSPTQMALAFINQQPFVASNIIGATTLEQLKENIDSVDVTLGQEVLTGIEAISKTYSNPCP